MSLFAPQNPLDKHHSFSGKVAWQSPSNIALIKYWGKRPVQLPANASISFTLSHAHTKTSVAYSPRSARERWIDFTFEGVKEETFATRIEKYFSSISSLFPFISDLSFQIESSNSFPHSSGIASSASSMSALSLCLCTIEQELYNLKRDQPQFLKKASYVARLGSGSACRSVYPHLAAWGNTSHLSEASDEYAIPVTGMDPVFKDFHDDVLIVSEEKKSVSSTAGHALMDTNVFAANRYAQADTHFQKIIEAMRSGDLATFGKIIEDEALTLHALMMCSDPSYILMEPATIAVIKKIRSFRETNKLPVYFTLDAGPNVHILYPESIALQARAFINEELQSLAVNNRIIKDTVGQGPVQLENNEE